MAIENQMTYRQRVREREEAEEAAREGRPYYPTTPADEDEWGGRIYGAAHPYAGPKHTVGAMPGRPRITQADDSLAPSAVVSRPQGQPLYGRQVNLAPPQQGLPTLVFGDVFGGGQPPQPGQPIPVTNPQASLVDVRSPLAALRASQGQLHQ